MKRYYSYVSAILMPSNRFLIIYKLILLQISKICFTNKKVKNSSGCILNFIKTNLKLDKNIDF
jgi:hypothetical protein